MRVLLAHALTPKRRGSRACCEAGHEVVEVDGSGRGARALPRVGAGRGARPRECCGDLVCEIKADPVAYGTAIIMIERPELSPQDAIEGMRRGVQDYLVEPVADGEVLTRVEAAARTKELQQELVAQGARLEALLREDALTGLSNRRAILTQLGGMVSGARRHGHPLVDRGPRPRPLQAINDTHGHKTGDEVLIAAAHAMGTHLRAEDQLGRLGGEEFLVLLPDTDADAAAHVAEKLRAEVAARADARAGDGEHRGGHLGRRDARGAAAARRRGALRGQGGRP